MTRPQIASAAVKTYFAALALTVAVGFLFYGINWANESLFSDCCADGKGTLLSVLRFWQAWWWFIYLALFYPMWLLFLVLFVRRFASPGSRLTAAGYTCIFQGSAMVLNLFTADLTVPGDHLITVIYASLCAAWLLVGAYLGFMRRHPHGPLPGV